MKTLDYFDDLQNTFDFVPLEDLQLSKTVDSLVENSRLLEVKIIDLEKKVSVIEMDVALLSTLGSQLQQEDSKLRLQTLTEQFLEEWSVDNLRCQLAELYGARQTIAKAISKFSIVDDSVNTTCSVCLERIVGVFNINCGHTMCDTCSAKVTRCPMCRSVANFRKILFSS
jgi:archaellum component FlaC